VKFLGTEQDPAPVGILYLGRRGGGARLTVDIATEFNNLGQKCVVIINSRNELKSKFNASAECHVLQIDISMQFFSLLPWYRNKKISQVIRIMRKHDAKAILISMSSPLDSYGQNLLSQNLRVIRIIHDAVKHHGDYWPTQRMIDHLVQSKDQIVVLSTPVKRLLADKYKKDFSLVLLPPPQLPSGDIDPFNHGYVLFIGRIRKYKNIDLLIESWGIAKLLNSSLIIAGEGKLSRRAKSAIRRSDSITLRNEWLDEATFATLVENASMIVFPYSEASQSGVLAYCLSRNKTVIITKLDGLTSQDQTGSRSKIFVAESNNAVSFAATLKLANVDAERSIVNGPTEKVIKQHLNFYANLVQIIKNGQT
jgi:glycosyltransferase involved in cell wall biosynthesis